ncbi:MAG TPA: flavodoxin domain-containing protein [Candidatus Methanoperedens sp.]|nr:flavodoxin domain-containing protein [Candidatus Methanoperedens sp.]HLB71977.1 flavodoxin domain-containing protein [Candidatus Methanoperedens sp.]
MANKKKILVAYASRTGNTEKLAEAIAEGVNGVEGVSVTIKRARDIKPGDAVSADGYAFGSHSAFEYMAGELKTLFEELYRVRDKMTGKPVLLFATGHGGQVAALESMDRVVGVFNPRWIKPGVAVEAMPDETEKARAVEMGKKLAEAVKK